MVYAESVRSEQSIPVARGFHDFARIHANDILKPESESVPSLLTLIFNRNPIIRSSEKFAPSQLREKFLKPGNPRFRYRRQSDTVCVKFFGSVVQYGRSV